VSKTAGKTRSFTVNGKEWTFRRICQSRRRNSSKEKSKSSPKMQSNKEYAAGRPRPKWLEYDAEEMSGKVVALPAERILTCQLEKTS